MVMLPFMPLVCTSAILGGMLHVHGRFAPTAAAPIVLNVFIIAAGALHFLPGGPDVQTSAFIIGVAAVGAGLVQVLWALWALRPFVRWTRLFAGAASSTRRMFSRFVPVLIGLGTLQLNALVDTLIAMWPIWVGPTIAGAAYPLDERSNVVLFFSQRLYQFPLGVFGIAVATAVFPLLAKAADEPGTFADTLRRGLRLSLFIGLPASVGLVLVRHDLPAVLFSGGRYGFSDAGVARSSAVLLGYAPAVWAYSLNHVLTRAFYAKGDTATPMKVAMAMVGLNVALNVTLIWPLREAGLAWSTSTCAVIQCFILALLCRRLLGSKNDQTTPETNRGDTPRLTDAPTRRAMIRTVAISALMGVVVLFTLWILETPTTWSGHMLALVLACGVGTVTYATLALVTRSPELRWLARR
jgi:putative peptidoglycan lipid II flippase